MIYSTGPLKIYEKIKFILISYLDLDKDINMLLNIFIVIIL